MVFSKSITMLSIIQKGKWLLGGNLLFAFSQWLLLIGMAKLANNTMVGEYSLALAIVSPVFMLTNLQLRPIVVAEYNLKDSFDYKNFFTLRLYTVIIGIIISCFSSLFTSSSIYLTVFLLALIKAEEAISDIIYAYYNAQAKTKLISLSLTIKSTALIIVFFILLYFLKSLAFSLIGIILVYLLVLIFIDFKNINFNKTYFHLDLSDSYQIILTALPLGLSVMLVALQSNLPRFFLEKFYNLEMVGIFSVFYYFVIVGGIIINSVCQFLSPQFSIYYKKNNKRQLFKLAIEAWLIGLILGFLGLAIVYFMGDVIVNLVYGKVYLNYLNTLNIIMFAGIFTYLSVVNGYLMTSLELIKIQLPLFVLLTLVTLILSYFLIIPKGLDGAAWVCVISSALQFIFSTLILYFKKIR